MSKSRNSIRVSTIVVIDLASKWLAQNIGKTHLTDPLTNTRFALGLAGAPTMTMVAAMMIGIIAACRYFDRMTPLGRIRPWAADLITAGAIANCIDRATTGAVHDFIPVGALVFNLADVALIVGFGAWAWQSFTHRPLHRVPPRQMINNS